jgi:hypothetical protein
MFLFFSIGYYADTESKCQVFHICTSNDKNGLSSISFLCPNGTIFNQNYFICDWWFNFDCSEAEGLYSLNDKIAAEREELASAAASDSLNTYSAASASQTAQPAPQPAPQASRQASPQASRKAAPQATRQAAPQPSLAAYEAQRAGRSRQFGPRFNSRFGF